MLSLSEIQQQRSQLQKELDKLDVEEKKLRSLEKYKKIEFLNDMIEVHGTMSEELEAQQLKYNEQKTKIQNYLRDNPEVDESTYHEIIRMFITRISKIMHKGEVVTGDTSNVVVYDFIFYGTGYHFELKIGLPNKPGEKYVLPTKEELMASEVLGVNLRLNRKNELMN